MIERINEYFARHFGGVGTSAGSFVRIHVWAIVFLVAISMAVPSEQLNLASAFTKKITTQNVALPYNDTRDFAPSPFGKNRFHIAWISGSEGYLKDEATNYLQYLPNLAASSLPARINGKRIGIDFYFLDAMRLGDIYFSLLDALKTKPDMIVISLNPAWVLNPLATHQWTQLDSRAAADLVTKPSAWPLAAELFSPSDLAWGLIDSHLKVFRDSAYYNDQIHQKVDGLGPLDLRDLPEAFASQVPDRSQQILNMLPVDFWLQYRLHEPRASNADRWAEWLDKSNQGGNSLNRTILHLIAQTLKSSKIPSYVYDAPVNSDWYRTSAPIKSAVTGIEDQLKDLRPEFTAPNIRYQPLNATRFVPPLQFLDNDLMHLTHADAMGPYLGSELCRLVKQVKDHAVCFIRKGANSG